MTEQSERKQRMVKAAAQMIRENKVPEATIIRPSGPAREPVMSGDRVVVNGKMGTAGKIHWMKDGSSKRLVTWDDGTESFEHLTPEHRA